MLETQAKQIINQVGSNTSKKLMDAISATADEAKATPKPKPQPKPQSQPKPQPQSQPKPPPQDPPKAKPQPTPPPKAERSQFGRVNEDAWRRYKSSGPTTSGPTSWRDGPSVIRDNLDEPIGTALELYDRRRRR